MSLPVIAHWKLEFPFALAIPLAVFGAAPALQSPSVDVAPLARAEFERLHRDLVPASPRTWEKAGWRVDLLSAREEARKSRRPIFLWAMNGHPLGCT